MLKNPDRLNSVSRRWLLNLLRGVGAVLLASCLPKRSNLAVAAPDCIVRPQQTEGPYFVDTRLQRSDIRSNPGDSTPKPGIPLQLRFQVSRLNGTQCQPLQGVIVDIWHCDAAGVYSDVADWRANTTGQKFLRGYQVTNANGVVQFLTLYPGWYPGRTVHIHFKIWAMASDRSYEFTSQLYFDDTLTDRIHAQAPYAQPGQRRTRNTNDGIFRQGGKQLMLAVVPSDEGYTATFTLGLRLA